MLCTYTISWFVLFTEQLILCGYCKEILQTEKLAGAERVKCLLEKDTLWLTD